MKLKLPPTQTKTCPCGEVFEAKKIRGVTAYTQYHSLKCVKLYRIYQL